MQITTRSVNDVIVADLVGDLDTQTSGPAGEELGRIGKGGQNKLLLNLEKVAFVSSAGLRIILRTAKHLEASGGKMKLCQVNGVVKEVMQISGFATLLDLHEKEADALAAF